MELDSFCLTKGGAMVPPPCTPLTTPAPVEAGGSSSGWTAAVIVACFAGFFLVVLLTWLGCHFYGKFFGSTTPTPSDQEAATPSAPLAVEYYPELPSILEVD